MRTVDPDAFGNFCDSQMDELSDELGEISENLARGKIDFDEFQRKANNVIGKSGNELKAYILRRSTNRVKNLIG